MKHSLSPASFTRMSSLGIASFLLLKKKNGEQYGLNKFHFKYIEWVSVHLYPGGIFIPLARKVTACHEARSLTTIPLVVFDHGVSSLFRRSYLTRLKMIHIHYTYHSFIPPRPRDWPFRFFLTELTYLTYL